MHPLIVHAAEVQIAQNWAPGACQEAFLMSSSDADHITSTKTEVWLWHLCKHTWLSSFLISAWKPGLPNSGGCLWRGSLIGVSIQSCVLLSPRCCLIPTESLQGCKFSLSTSSWTKVPCQAAEENGSGMREAESFSSLPCFCENGTF